MATQLIHGENAFDELAADWDELAGRGMTDTPFQTLTYQRAWWRYLHPESGRLHTVVVRDGDGRPEAIGSFYSVGDTLYFNGCVEETDYLDLISPAEAALSNWRAVLDCLESAPDVPWQAFDLCNVPAESPTRAALRRLAEERGYTFAEEVYEVCPIILLPRTFDEYLESLDSKQRRELSRKLRRAEASDVITTIVGPDDDVDAAVDEFLTLLQKSALEKRDWLNEGRRAVFRETARAAQAAGTLQLMFTAVDGKKAAALFNFDYKNRIWVYNSGLDPVAFSGLSLGVVLTATAIETAINLGREVFDFLRGSEEYKYRFGAVDTQIYRLHLQRPASP